MTCLDEIPPALPGWLRAELPFRRRMVRIDGYRIHFVDQGEGPVVFMLHGNPTWCFLWRKVIPIVARFGFRVIAPDLVGLGLSDKPRDPAFHTLGTHIALMTKLVDTLGIEEMTIMGHDWGGPIAAGVAAAESSRVSRALFANTSLLVPKRPIRTTAFHRFAHIPHLSEFVFQRFNFPVPVMHFAQRNRKAWTRIQRMAYHWPLRNREDRVAPLALARMVPSSETHPSIPHLEKTEAWLRAFQGRLILLWGKYDPILGRALHRMQEAAPHAIVQTAAGGHFLQEEVPEAFGRAVCILHE